MALSFVQYNGNGISRNWPVPFAYIDPAHVGVTINGAPAAFTFLSPNTVRTNAAAPSGSIVEVRRTTPNQARLVDYIDGSVLSEADLDKDSNQLFFIVQEAFDLAGGSLNVLEDGSYGAGNRRISNVANPVNA